jgi:hypothetical protein
MFESSRAEHVAFDSGADAVEYVGRHHGYERLASPVTHERRVRLDGRTGAITTEDRLIGRGGHELRWHFHLAPGVAAATVDTSTAELRRDGCRWHLRAPAGVRLSIGAAEYSPSYGVIQPCLAVDGLVSVTLAGESSFAFSIVPQ